MEETELIAIEKQENLIELFRKQGAVSALLNEIEKTCNSFVFDATTAQGRKDAKSLARKVSRSKTLIIEAGKRSVEDLKVIVKNADEQRIFAEKFLNELRDKIKHEAEEWERIDEERKTKIKNNLSILSNISEESFLSIESVNVYFKTIEDLKSFDFEGSGELACNLMEKALNHLNASKDRLEKEAKEKEELEQLRREKAEREEKERQELIEKERAEREERIRKEAEEKAKLDAENKAKEEKEKLEREAREAKERADRAEAQRKEQEERSRIEQEQAIERAKEQERKRLQDEEDKKIAEQKKREADTENKKRVNNEALEDLLKNSNIVESEARMIIVAIATGKIRNVKINY